MNILAQIRGRFAQALGQLVDDPSELLDMVRSSQDAKFGDYQANCAMPLGKRLSRPPREIAEEIVQHLKIDDLCEPPQIAGPGFINLRLRSDWIVERLEAAGVDERLGVELTADPKTYVIDYSAPNVAKPMHVGHIRSTVIGDSLYRTLRFLGHRVIGDNHIGDWGTQFGMIIYGYRNFCDVDAYEASPVAELARLYRLVNTLVDYQASHDGLAAIEQQITEKSKLLETQQAAPPTGDKKADKKSAKAVRKRQGQVNDLRTELKATKEKIATIDADPVLSKQLSEHPAIRKACLAETVRLHDGDADNLRLWEEFLPPCREDIERIYRRLGITFDYTLGESFYHDRLAAVVDDLREKKIAVESDGAMCVFFEGDDVPMIVQKQDGAFLYSTTDLATLQYRVDTWGADAILYVVDHRQALHFEHLFSAARRWGYDQVELKHVVFGTVLGGDGRPYKTRSGDTVGLEGLLDEAIRKAHEVVSAGDDAKPDGPELDEEARSRISEVVGIAALKYADLSQNRSSDYTFSYEKMLALSGNTATYMQYAYARVRNIFARGQIDAAALRSDTAAIIVDHPAERAMALALLQFSEALEQTLVDYRPNLLTDYLFALANQFSTFYQQCHVLKAETEELRTSRLKLADLTARVIKQGLALLGIEVVEKM
ncbi:MAG: arginine--tRNA ligase [Planctomycetes bacterium]|nr:arginine--tRNA ligase [Planctomycetota bacterium]